MPQSLTRLYSHLVFSTKNRHPWLSDQVGPRVHAYLATILRDMNCPWAVVGGVADHVHLLFDIGKSHSPVEIVERVKRESSKFVKTLGADHQSFYWQRGYGMFSLSPMLRNEAEAYICNQEEHHKRQSYQDEFRSILDRYRIEYDERYMWD